MRKKFELTDEQFNEILEACRPVRYMVFNGMPPRSPQENANAAWCDLGRRLGFDGMSVEPVPGGSQKEFTANTVQMKAAELKVDDQGMIEEQF